MDNVKEVAPVVPVGISPVARRGVFAEQYDLALGWSSATVAGVLAI